MGVLHSPMSTQLSCPRKFVAISPLTLSSIVALYLDAIAIVGVSASIISKAKLILSKFFLLITPKIYVVWTSGDFIWDRDYLAVEE